MKTKIVDQWYRPDKTRKPRCNRGARWLARWEHDGSRGSKTFDIKGQAKLWLAQQKVAFQDGGLILTNPSTVEQWINRWVAEHPTLKGQTRTAYKSVIRTWIIPTVGHMRLEEIRDYHVEDMYREMAATAPTAIQKAHTILNQSFGQAVKVGAMHRNPMPLVVKPQISSRQHRTRVKVLTASEVETVLDLLSTADKLIFLFLLETGLRPGEMAALSVDDVDLKRGLINVSRSMDGHNGTLTCTKTGRDRQVPMSAIVREIVTEATPRATRAEVAHGHGIPGGTSARRFLFPSEDPHYVAPLPCRRP